MSCSELLSASSLAVMAWSRSVTCPVATLGVPPTPPAFPMAVTAAPTARVEEFPMVTVVSFDAPTSFKTATSCDLSVPTTVASYDCPLPTSVTLTLVAPSTTWLLVRT